MKEKIKLIILIIIAGGLILGSGWIVYNNIKAKNEGVTHPIATFEIQDYGTIKMELYPEYAPNTVTNIIALINAGYYNNKVISGKDDMCLYMARGVDDEEDIAPKLSLIDNSVELDSENDYEYEINGEFIANGFDKNLLRHEKGAVSLNHSDYSAYRLYEEGYNSGSAQFSVMIDDESNLNGLYCVFGKIVEGFDVLENIYQNLETIAEESDEETSSIKEFSNKPVIINATVETNGVDYGMPEVHEAFDIQEYLNELYSSYYSN